MTFIKQKYLQDAYICLQSYNTLETYTEYFKDVGYVQEVQEVQEGDSNAFIIYHQSGDVRDMCIVFRGTDSLQDTMTSAHKRLIPIHINGQAAGMVHSGFYEYYMTIRDKIVTEIERFALSSSGKCSVRVLGHSLGGCAIFAALESRFLIPRADITYTSFGSPMIGDAKFCSFVNEVLGPDKIVRIVSPYDVVPFYPFSTKFSHFGVEQTIPTHSNTFIKMVWLTQQYNTVQFYFAIIMRTVYSLYFHSMYTYIRGLKEM